MGRGGGGFSCLLACLHPFVRACPSVHKCACVCTSFRLQSHAPLTLQALSGVCSALLLRCLGPEGRRESYRRLLETWQWVCSVTFNVEALKPGGDGWKSILYVRCDAHRQQALCATQPLPPVRHLPLPAPPPPPRTLHEQGPATSPERG